MCKCADSATLASGQMSTVVKVQWMMKITQRNPTKWPDSFRSDFQETILTTMVQIDPGDSRNPADLPLEPFLLSHKLRPRELPFFCEQGQSFMQCPSGLQCWHSLSEDLCGPDAESPDLPCPWCPWGSSEASAPSGNWALHLYDRHPLFFLSPTLSLSWLQSTYLPVGVMASGSH